MSFFELLVKLILVCELFKCKNILLGWIFLFIFDSIVVILWYNRCFRVSIDVFRIIDLIKFWYLLVRWYIGKFVYIYVKLFVKICKKKKKMREKERFWIWNMNKFFLFYDDMKIFWEFDLFLGLFFMIGLGLGYCLSLMFNKEVKFFN